MISVCIPLKNRVGNLKRCIEALDSLKGIGEIVIGDFSSTDTDFAWLQDSKIPTKVINIEGDFSIGKGKNVAAEAAAGDVLFFLDADIVTPQGVIDKINDLVPKGYVYCPVMWMEESPDGEDPAHWGVFSHGQIAVTKEQWQKHKWVEWSSYGGDDDLFFEPYKYTAIVDLALDFIHKWHPHDDRTKNYTKEAGSDLAEYLEEKYGNKEHNLLRDA